MSYWIFISRSVWTFHVYGRLSLKLLRLSYFETTHSGYFIIPQKGYNRVYIYFNEEGRQAPFLDPISAVFAKIPLNCNRGGKDLDPSIYVIKFTLMNFGYVSSV